MSEGSILEPAPTPNPGIKRFIPLAAIAAALSLFFALGGPDYISLEMLKANREFLAAFVADNFWLTFFGFIAIYAVLVAISVPGASLLTIFGGFLFGTIAGAAAVVMGATLGAVGIFLAARYAIGDALTQKAGPYMQKFEAGLHENELSYMFILRLVPIFPFFIVNIVPALFNVKLRNYAIATFFGIIPGSFVYASIGNGVGAFFDAGEEVPLSGLMTQPSVLIPIIGLIALALIPVVYKRIKRA